MRLLSQVFSSSQDTQDGAGIKLEHSSKFVLPISAHGRITHSLFFLSQSYSPFPSLSLIPLSRSSLARHAPLSPPTGLECYSAFTPLPPMCADAGLAGSTGGLESVLSLAMDHRRHRQALLCTRPSLSPFAQTFHSCSRRQRQRHVDLLVFAPMWHADAVFTALLLLSGMQIPTSLSNSNLSQSGP